MISEKSSTDWFDLELQLFQETVQKFLANEHTPNIERWRKEGVVDRAFWKKTAEVGILGATIPEAYGGMGLPLSYDYITLLEQARCGDFGWGFGIQSYVTHYIVNYGTEDQKQRWLPGLVSGDLVCSLGMTEPGAGSDLKSIKTTAIRNGDRYLVNGSKTFITNGQSADLVCLAVKTDPKLGAKGVSLIIIETAHADGFTRGRNLAKLGMKANDTSELAFNDVEVPAENLLGGVEGQGFVQMMHQLPWERLGIAATALGAMDHALEQTLAYVKERKAFDQRLMDMQNTRFKLAECKTRIEVTRSFVESCLEKLLVGRLDAATASMAKYWSSECQSLVMDELLQLFGGYGYMLEYPISHAYVDARVQRIYGGTNEIMKEVIARSLDQS